MIITCQLLAIALISSSKFFILKAMSSVIEEFLCLQTNDETHTDNKYGSIWGKIQKQIDRFDEYRIAKALNHEIQQNQDLINELMNLLQIWNELTLSKNNEKIKNEENITAEDNHFDQRFFEIPERQLLQNQILLSLKEIKRNGLEIFLSFNKKSSEYNTLMYIINTSNNTSTNKNKSQKNIHKRPQTSFTISTQKMMRNEINICLNNSDIIQQTKSALNDERQILFHRVSQLRIKLDDICEAKLTSKTNLHIGKQIFIPSTMDMQQLNERLQEICNKHIVDKYNVKKNTIKLKPLRIHAKTYR
eukprot:172806_1